MTEVMMKCPACGNEFPASDAFEATMREQIQSELNAELQSARDALSEQSCELEERQKAITDQESEIAKRIHAGIAQQREALLVEAKKKIRSELEVEITSKDNELLTLRGKVKEQTAREIEFLKAKQEFAQAQEEAELVRLRKLDESRKQIKADTWKQATEEFELKLREKNETIEGLRKKADELQRKAEQGSQQLQGEVQELLIEEMLHSTFPSDDIQEIKKGERGADVKQIVCDPLRRKCGTILWESKRAKNWAPKWLQKIREDQRQINAVCCVIVSEILPEGISTFDQIDGVWVCSRSTASALAAALRAGIIETANARRGFEGRKDKMSMVYDYLMSEAFKHRVQGIVEAFTSMQDGLAKEQRAIQRHWAQRTKQIELAISNTVGLYGDLQGIAGATLPEIEGIDFAVLPSDQDSDSIDDNSVAVKADHSIEML